MERELRAWVDLAGLEAGRHTVRLHVSAPTAGRVIGLEPLYAQVLLEEKPAGDEAGGKGEPGKPEAPEGVNGPGSPPGTGDSSSSLPARPAEPDRGRE
ncbi:MAG: hypothetical protein QJR13_07335 [Bacillota bacterium]|nr:hypothetical protein [Bacillota bacterium]